MIQVRPSPPSPPPLMVGSPSNLKPAVLHCSPPPPPPPVVWCGVIVPALSCTVPLPPAGWCGVVVPAARPLLQQQRHQRHHHHHHHHHHHPRLVPPQTRCVAGFCAPLPCGVVWCGPVLRPLLQQQRQYPQVRSLHCHKDRLCLTVDGFGATPAGSGGRGPCGTYSRRKRSGGGGVGGGGDTIGGGGVGEPGTGIINSPLSQKEQR